MRASTKLGFVVLALASGTLLHAQPEGMVFDTRQCDSSPRPAGIVRISSGVAARRALKLKGTLIPTELARKLKEQVIVLLDVNESGSPTCVGISSESNGIKKEEGQTLVQAIFQAAQEWRFDPYILNSKPIAIRTLVPLKVKVQKGAESKLEPNLRRPD